MNIVVLLVELCNTEQMFQWGLLKTKLPFVIIGNINNFNSLGHLIIFAFLLPYLPLFKSLILLACLFCGFGWHEN